MTAQSIAELTNYELNELAYNSADTAISGTFVYQVCDMLDKCYINVKPTGTYDETVADGVAQFQAMMGLPVTGILTTSVWQSMILYTSRLQDAIESDGDEQEDPTIDDLTESPHYNAFFDDRNFKVHRKNHKDIKIVFGNKSITKTIKNVFMRSVSVEVDTSGNPVSEIYEFIAQDVVESDEISDVMKYTGANELTTPSDIKYDFSFIKPKASSYKPSYDISASSRYEGGGGASSVTGGSGYSGGGSGGGSR